MEAKELRIGNLVTDEWNSQVIKVDSIDDKGINLEIEDDGNYPELAKRWIEPCYKFECLYPIPLTEELLLKCGFKKTDNNWVILYLQFMSFGWEKFARLTLSINGNIMYLVHIKYVHQLQNLYFALTGEELVFTE